MSKNRINHMVVLNLVQTSKQYTLFWKNKNIKFTLKFWRIYQYKLLCELNRPLSDYYIRIPILFNDSKTDPIAHRYSSTKLNNKNMISSTILKLTDLSNIHKFMYVWILANPLSCFYLQWLLIISIHTYKVCIYITL